MIILRKFHKSLKFSVWSRDNIPYVHRRGLRIFESENRPFHRRFDFFLHHPIHVTKVFHFRNLKWNVKDKDSLNVVTSFFPNFIAFHLFIIYYYFLIVSKASTKDWVHSQDQTISKSKSHRCPAARRRHYLRRNQQLLSLRSIDYSTNRFSLELNNIKLFKICADTKIIGNLYRRLLEFKDLEWSLSNSIPSAEQLVNKNNITHLPIGRK